MPRVLPEGRQPPTNVDAAIAAFESAYAASPLSRVPLVKRSPLYKQLIARGFQGNEVVEFMRADRECSGDVGLGIWDGPRECLDVFCTMVYLEHGEWMDWGYSMGRAFPWWRPTNTGRTAEEVQRLIARTYEALPSRPGGKDGRMIPALANIAERNYIYVFH